MFFNDQKDLRIFCTLKNPNETGIRSIDKFKIPLMTLIVVVTFDGNNLTFTRFPKGNNYY